MRVKRALAAVSVIAAAGVVPIVTAAPASADISLCKSYLSKWYTVGPKVTKACTRGSYDGSGVSDCSNQLVAIGVTRSRANNACSYAHMTEGS
jgi:hypothetical protein